MNSKMTYDVDVAVLILFFNRPDQLRQVFEQVRKARPSRLFLYQDGPRSDKDMPGIMACRQVVEDVDWDCEVMRMYQERNYGCDPSEYISQRWAFDNVDKCIVLEDDDVPCISFFTFCKEMLDRYEHDTRITMISGFNVEEKTTDVDADYFFSTNFSIWGWASWRRVIDQWDARYEWLDDRHAVGDLQALIKERGYRDDFLPMCRRHRSHQKPFYESIFWAHLLMSGGLCIVPSRNMVSNLGPTSDSTHFGGSLHTLPHGYRRIFTMGRYEVTCPLRHPRYVMEHVAYRKRAYRIMGWMSPWTKIARSLEELLLNIRYGNWRHIWKSLVARSRKLTGMHDYH